MSMISLKSCRICNHSILVSVIEIGEQFLTSRFPKENEDIPHSPMTLVRCENCGLVQLKHSVSSNEMYENQYGYRSGISDTMRKHLKQYNEQIRDKIIINDQDLILDIGCNDGTFLNFYPKGRKIGIDPTGKQFLEYHNNLEIISDYFNYENILKYFKSEVKFKIISSISMFYDLPNPIQFAKDIYNLLEDDGIWTMEQSYIISMLQKNSFDTICHEHLEYYALKQIKYIADNTDLKIIDIQFNECNGGSFRLYLAKKNSQFDECVDVIQNILQNEKYLDELETYSNFMKNCNDEMDKLKLMIDTINKNKKTIYIYGASTKGNTLIQYINLSNKVIPFAVERNKDKIGRYTPGTNIKIISEEIMRENPPDYLLVLPWHFKNEIIERESDFLKNGGKLIFPLPKFEIVSTRENILITGIDGLIGSELKKNI